MTQKILPYLLNERAADLGDKCFIKTEEGIEYSYRDIQQLTAGTAEALLTLGVKRDDRVLVFMKNSIDMIRIWLGINYIGAVYVPINTGLQGELLENVVETADPAFSIIDSASVARFQGIFAPDARVVSIGDQVSGMAFEVIPGDVLDPIPNSELLPPKDLSPWDLQSIQFTSGTTGRSKGVMISHSHHYEEAERGMFYVTERDRYLITCPLFHMAGTMFIVGSLIKQSSVGLTESFKTDWFWSQVISTGSTSCLLIGAMADFLLGRAPSAVDQAHPLRKVTIMPYGQNAVKFGERFGVDMYTFFDMTELPAPLASGANPSQLGTCGRALEGYTVKIVDENDNEVPPGTVGELIVRPERPWTMLLGYFRNPEATAAAWRNGWFHTGDAFRCDSNGNYYFIDRIKDAIRRRGENISSFELEAVIQKHPDIAEAAAIPVTSEISEDEILLVVVPKKGVELDVPGFVEWQKTVLPAFAVSRFVRVMKQLPVNETSKVNKRLLKLDGVTSDTWDRQNPAASVRSNTTPEVVG